MRRWESYRFRRLPIQMPPFVMRPSDNKIIPMPPAAAAQVRCDALRAIMRMEMPERWNDITDGNDSITVWYDPLNKIPYKDPNRPTYPMVVTMPIPAALQAYEAYYQTAITSSAFLKNRTYYPSAKCLYLFVTMGLEENDVLETFSQDDIADVDGSGAKCFIDAWGQPIKFLRWAPGYVSRLQPNPPTDADFTDPSNVYGSPGGLPQTYALYPVIYSAGPDGYYDIVEDADPPNALHYNTAQVRENPFYSMGGAKAYFSDGPLGTAAVEPVSDRATGRAVGAADNIDNHSIGRR
jgi:hypothetical protein